VHTAVSHDLGADMLLDLWATDEMKPVRLKGFIGFGGVIVINQ
jgi:hypothetical protein